MLFINPQSRFASAALGDEIGPSHPARQNLAVSLYLGSSISNIQGKVEGASRTSVSPKKAFQASETETRELLGGTKEDCVGQ